MTSTKTYLALIAVAIIALAGLVFPLSHVVTNTEDVAGITNYDSLVLNDAGENVDDTRFEGDTNENLFLVDVSADRIGIGSSTPTDLFSVGNGVSTSTVNLGKLCLQTVSSSGSSIWLYINSSGNWATSTSATICS